MGEINFKLVDESAEQGPDLSERSCRCPRADDQYLMEVDCGSVNFVHAACGKPPSSWADDSFSMQPVAVTLHWTASTDYWTGEVDAYGDVTVNGLPQEAQDAAKKLARQHAEQQRAQAEAAWQNTTRGAHLGSISGPSDPF